MWQGVWRCNTFQEEYPNERALTLARVAQDTFHFLLKQENQIPAVANKPDGSTTKAAYCVQGAAFCRLRERGLSAGPAEATAKMSLDTMRGAQHKHMQRATKKCGRQPARQRSAVRQAMCHNKRSLSRAAKNDPCADRLLCRSWSEAQGAMSR